MLLIATILGLAGSAWGKAPSAPTNGSVYFSRAGYPRYGTLTGLQLNTWHSYNLVWQDNASDEEGYVIYQRFGISGAWRPWQALPANSAQAIVSVEGTPKGTVVQFKVEVWKFNGTVSEASSLQINTVVPDSQVTLSTPSNLTATLVDRDPSPSSTSLDDGRVLLTWVDNSSTDLQQQVQMRQIRPNMGEQDWVDVGIIPFGPQTFTLSNLLVRADGRRLEFIPGQAYQFRLRAIRDQVTNWNETPSSVETGALQIPQIKAPTGLQVTADGEDSFRLSWEDNSSNETGYSIEGRPSGPGAQGEFKPLYLVAENVRDVKIPIAPNTGVEFRVMAYLSHTPTGGNTAYFYSDYSGAASASTGTLLAPADLAATTSGVAGTVDLSWTDRSAVDDGHDILVRPAGSAEAFAFARAVPHGVTRVSVDSFTTSDLDAGIPTFTPFTKGTTYEFIVRAVAKDETSSSTPSNIATATPKHGFTSKLAVPFQVGEAFTHGITTSDAASLAQLTVTGLPYGLSFDAPSATISGTPTIFGHFPCAMTAVFQDGTTARATLHLRGTPATATPVVKQTLANRILSVGTSLSVPLDDFFSDVDSETVVRFATTKGNVDFILYPSAAPAAVANFLAYVNAGDYDQLVLHRLTKDFVLQAGSLRAVSAPKTFASVLKRPSALNEPGLSNLPWTLSAAKRGMRTSMGTDGLGYFYRDENFGYMGAPDSATTDFCINLADNAANLDNQNSGFTVFGRVADASKPVVNAIHQLPVANYLESPTDRRIILDNKLEAAYDVPMDAAAAPAEMDINLTVRVVTARVVPGLTYSVASPTGEQNVTASIANGHLQLTGASIGLRELTVTARDADGGSRSQTLTVSSVAEYAPPAITKQPASVLVNVNGTATFSVTATGPELTYQWRRNGVPISGRTAPSLTFAPVQIPHEGSYDVVVSNANTSVTSAAATLTLRAPADIISELPNQLLITAGQPLDLSVAVLGGPEPVFTWKRGSTVIKGQTTHRLHLPTTTLADAGAYKGTASNGKTDTTNACQVFIVDKSTRTVVAAPGKPVKLAAPVAGPFTQYSWRKNGQPILPGTSGFTGMTSATLSITAAGFGIDSADYTCVVTPPANLPVTVSGIVRLAVSQKPQLSAMTGENAPPQGYVGDFYSYTLPYPKDVDGIPFAANTVATFSVKGLPPGLTCHATTGVISGYPTQQGTYTITATAQNPAGTGLAVNGAITIIAMETAGAGTFVALVNPSPNINRDKGGRLDLTVTDNASLSAKLLLAGDSYLLKGALKVTPYGGQLVYASSLSFKNKAGRMLDLLIIISPSTGDVIGSVSDGPVGANFYGHRQTWSEARKPCVFAGVQNLGLNLPQTDVGRPGIPQGDGYTTLTISYSGIGTFAGKLPDGTSITGSSIVSTQGQYCLFQMLYTNTGSLLARIGTSIVRSDNSSTASLRYHSTQGEARWIRDGFTPAKDKLYGSGFSEIVMNVSGWYHQPPRAQFTPVVMNLMSVPANTRLDFSHGGLPLAAVDPDITLQLDNANKATFPTTNPAKVTLKVNAATGVYTGTFELQDDSKKRSVTFQGLIIPQIDSIPGLTATSNLQAQQGAPPRGTYGAGYFLLDQLLIPPAKAVTSQLSGKARLSANPLVLTTTPEAQTVATGANASFMVAVTGGIVSGDTILVYEWRRNGMKLANGLGVAGATTATLTLTGVNATYAGSYQCTISQRAIVTVSQQAYLLDQNVLNTDPVQLTVQAP
ncbi:MAG: immunoglobulin domain-containing protein [Verrucomicrobiota bacterium]